MKNITDTIRYLLAAILSFAAALQSSAAFLPPEYTQLPYIKANKNVQLRTDYTPHGTDKIVMTWTPTQVSSTEILWCARTTSNYSTCYTVFAYGGNKVGIYYSGASVEDGKSNSNFTVNKFENLAASTKYTIAVDGNAKSLVVTNAYTGAETVNISWTRSNNFTAGSQICLFASHGSNITPNNNWSSHYLHSFKVYSSNGTLKRDLVPAKRNSDGAIGLYDTVSQTFKVKSTSGGSLSYALIDKTFDANATLIYDEVFGTVTVNSGNTLNLNGHNLTANSIAGSGTITGTTAAPAFDLTEPDSNRVSCTTTFWRGTAANLFNDNYERSGMNNYKRIIVATNDLPLVVDYDFRSPQVVNLYKIYCGPMEDVEERCPKSWELYCSNDNENWVLLDSRSDVTDWAATAQDTRSYSFANTTAYRYYRFKGLSSNADYLEMMQLEYCNSDVGGGLHLNVSSTLRNTTVALAGKLRLYKEGAGTYVEAKANQTYTGGMEIRGGTVTEETDSVLAGPATVVAGTELVVNSPAALGGGLAVVLPVPAPPKSIYTLVSIASGSDAVFSASDIESIVAPEGYVLAVSSDGKSIKLMPTGSGVWTGAAGNLLIEDPGNWSGNAVPNGETAYISLDTDDTLLCNETFSPKSITFGAQSASVTIAGTGAITGIGAVTNLSSSDSSVVSFQCPVTFAGTYKVNRTGMVNFPGGATATYPDSSIRTADSDKRMRTLNGNFTFTEDWTVPDLGASYDKPWVVVGGARVQGKLFTGLQNGHQRILWVENGGYARFTTVTNGWARGDIDINGTLEVDGEMIVRTNPSATSSYSHFGRSGNTGTVKAWRIAKSEHAYVDSMIPNLIVGAGGIGSVTQDYTWRFIVNTTITATNDFEFLGVKSSANPADWGVMISNVTLTVDVPEGKTVTAGAGIRDGGANGGKIRKTGAGTLVMSDTFNGQSGFRKTYTGGTTVDGGTLKVLANGMPESGTLTLAAGTTLEVPSTGVGTGGAIAFSGSGTVTLKVSGSSLADGDYLLVSSGGLPSNYASVFAVDAPTGSETVLYSPDGRELRLLVGNAVPSAHIWTGAAGDGKMATAGNWLGNAVPSSGGETVFFPDASGTIANDIDGFAPKSITFGTGSGAVTITGNGITGLWAVTNLSTAANATFAVPVSYAAGRTIEVCHGGKFSNSTWTFVGETGMVIFAGGVDGEEVMHNTSGSHNIYAGVYRRNGSSAYDGSASGSDYRGAIYDNSSLTVKSATNTMGICIGRGGAFTAGVQSASTRLCVVNRGEYVVNNTITAVAGFSSCWDNRGWSGIPAFKVGGIFIPDGNGSCLGSETTIAITNMWFIGESGLRVASGKAGFFYTRMAADRAILRPWRNNLTIHAGSTKEGDIYIGAGEQNGGTVEFRSEDENGEPRTITIDGKVACRDAIKSACHVEITGSGMTVLNSVSAFRGDTVVAPGATLAINPGSSLGTGGIAVNAGATLALPQSGIVTIPGEVTLDDGAILAFNFTSADTSPKFVFSTGGATAIGTVEVKVSAAGVFPRRLDRRWLIAEGVSGGSFALVDAPSWADGVSVEGSNLYLDVKRPGLSLSVR